MVSIDKNHEELFSGCSLTLGKIHWIIQKADTEMQKKVYVQIDKNGPLVLDEIKYTDFGMDVGPDEIYWWIFKREKDIDELKKQTEEALIPVQKLKEDSALLEKKYRPKSYNELILKLKEFNESHKNEIETLYNYVI